MPASGTKGKERMEGNNGRKEIMEGRKEWKERKKKWKEGCIDKQLYIKQDSTSPSHILVFNIKTNW